MYMVYRLSFNRDVITSGENIVAIYARKGGAYKRLELLARAYEGATFGIALLPEGAAPKFVNVKEVVAVMRIEPTRPPVATDDLMPGDELPF